MSVRLDGLLWEQEAAGSNPASPTNSMTHKILLIGDSCVDEYYVGHCDRLSPEAPVPVIKIVNRYNTPGMAANVQSNFNRLGCQITFITNPELIIKARYIDERSGQHLLRVDHEPQLMPWNSAISEPLNSFDALVVSDYDKGFISYQDIEDLIQGVQCPVFIDTKKKDLAKFEGAFVKINSLERAAASSLCSNLIVTQGNKGALYQNVVYPTVPVEVTDVCGAGDTFLASLVYEYLNTRSIEQAIRFANIASAITVTKNGVYAPSLDEIKRIIHEQN